MITDKFIKSDYIILDDPRSLKKFIAYLKSINKNHERVKVNFKPDINGTLLMEFTEQVQTFNKDNCDNI